MGKMKKKASKPEPRVAVRKWNSGDHIVGLMWTLWADKSFSPDEWSELENSVVCVFHKDGRLPFLTTLSRIPMIPGVVSVGAIPKMENYCAVNPPIPLDGAFVDAPALICVIPILGDKPKT